MVTLPYLLGQGGSTFGGNHTPIAVLIRPRGGRSKQSVWSSFLKDFSLSLGCFFAFRRTMLIRRPGRSHLADTERKLNPDCQDNDSKCDLLSSIRLLA